MIPKIAATILCATAIAHAEPKRVGIEATLAVPLSPWKHETGIGGGGSIWLHVPASPRMTVTARLGAIVHASRPLPNVAGAMARLSEVPLVGGARLRFTDGAIRTYLEGELGLVFRRVDVDVANLSDNTSRIRIGSSLGGAVELDRFSVRAAVWFADLSDRREIGIIASVGAHIYEF